MPYLEEFAWVMDTYPVIWYSFFSLYVAAVYTVLLGLGPLVIAGLWTIKRGGQLPPFLDAVSWSVQLQLKLIGSVAFLAGILYVMVRWSQGADMVLAIFVVSLPIYLLWVYRDYIIRHSLVFWGITMVLVGIPTVSYILYYSSELRWIMGSMAAGVVIAMIVYALLSEKIAEAYRQFPKLILTSLLSSVLLYLSLAVITWSSYNIPAYDRPGWYDYVSYSGLALVPLAFLPLIVMEFLKISGGGRRY